MNGYDLAAIVIVALVAIVAIGRNDGALVKDLLTVLNRIVGKK